MVTGIPIAGKHIVQWFWGGYTVSKCGIRSYSFSSSSGKIIGQVNEPDVESKHSLLNGCVGSKDFYDYSYVIINVFNS